METHDGKSKADELIDATMHFLSEAVATFVFVCLGVCLGGVLMTVHYQRNVEYRCVPKGEVEEDAGNEIPSADEDERCFYEVSE